MFPSNPWNIEKRFLDKKNAICYINNEISRWLVECCPTESTIELEDSVMIVIGEKINGSMILVRIWWQ